MLCWTRIFLIYRFHQYNHDNNSDQHFTQNSSQSIPYKTEIVIINSHIFVLTPNYLYKRNKLHDRLFPRDYSDFDWLWSNVTSVSLLNSKRLTFDQHIFVDLHKKERQKQETYPFTTKFLKSILWLATWNHVSDDKPKFLASIKCWIGNNWRWQNLEVCHWWICWRYNRVNRIQYCKANALRVILALQVLRICCSVM